MCSIRNNKNVSLANIETVKKCGDYKNLEMNFNKGGTDNMEILLRVKKRRRIISLNAILWSTGIRKLR